MLCIFAVMLVPPERTDSSQQPVTRQKQPKNASKSIENTRKHGIHLACQYMPQIARHIPRQTCRFPSFRWAQWSSPVGGCTKMKHSTGKRAGAGEGRGQICERLHSHTLGTCARGVPHVLRTYLGVRHIHTDLIGCTLFTSLASI